MTSQEQFEAWAQETPREWGIEKQTVQGTFPGQYRAYHVQAAWEAWEARSTVDQEQKPVARILHRIQRMPPPYQEQRLTVRSYEECPENAYPNDWREGAKLYEHPAPTRELKDAVDDLAQHIRQIDGNHSMGAGALAEGIAEWTDRYLKGERE